MSFSPTHEPTRERALALIEQKDTIQAQIEHHLSILRTNNSTMQSPLVDAEGFPRADIDVASVRTSRVRIIELRNDLDAVMEEISSALQGLIPPDTKTVPPADSSLNIPRTNGNVPEIAFALVNGVAPNSPAAAAGLLRGDLVTCFGSLTASSFGSTTSLQSLASLVSSHENQPIEIRVRRGDLNSNSSLVTLSLTPRSGWGGRGLLGCHIVPYSA
ncbi:proteasome 26S subunit [Cantharellus anzutake]|uniref:proteasome 26S subunit n=1 Tax=Cantharellus anzutake TaxID=1750568 RepID=UPI001903820E|nr:proteasome 26S subunit [Cantharellus anzutake]KAF8313959.1 proteasome 26S subunit [Cantharellus anzutake]